ncbi:hypothetical protein CAter10_2608 [Collimonas arenae]|nr:hypothetical protein CAter10_2608 [Collimonas arenae]
MYADCIAVTLKRNHSMHITKRIMLPAGMAACSSTAVGAGIGAP